jgi:hypothetical protein
MSNAKTTTSSGGIGLAGATFLVFLFCKLTGQIDWSWWWVTAPLWGGFVIFVAVILALAIFALGCFVVAAIGERICR